MKTKTAQSLLLLTAVMWAWNGADVLPKAEQERLDKEMDRVGMPKTNRKSSAGLAEDAWPTLAKRIEAAGHSPVENGYIKAVR